MGNMFGKHEGQPTLADKIKDTYIKVMHKEPEHHDEPHHAEPVHHENPFTVIATPDKDNLFYNGDASTTSIVGRTQVGEDQYFKDSMMIGNAKIVGGEGNTHTDHMSVMGNLQIGGLILLIWDIYLKQSTSLYII